MVAFRHRPNVQLLNELMTPIKRKLLYIFRGSLLRLRISWAKRTLTISVGYHVDRTDAKGKPKWDGSRCKMNTFHGKDKVSAATINKVLENLESSIDTAFYSFEQANSIPTTIQLKKQLNPDKNADKVDFWNAFQLFIQEGERKSQWSSSTINGMRHVRDILKAYNPDLMLKDITSETMSDFALWQQTHRYSNYKLSNRGAGYTNTVIKRHNSVIIWFAKWAVRKGLISINPDQLCTPVIKTIQKPIVFLTWNELLRLEQYPFKIGSPMDKARDFLCFCCFTSLRYSDAVSLSKSAIQKDSFDVVTQKTNIKITIDLNSHSRSILEKYRDSDSEKALPYISKPYLNNLIKKIGEKLGFDSPVTISQFQGSIRVDTTYKKWELLSSHCGRRTFICNALMLGISPQIVMKWTGHSEYSAMRPYIDIADEARKSEMKKFDKFSDIAINNSTNGSAII